ncbi:MAG: aminotransferase class V-fold PLP-dependent enzyme [Gemmatimonadaceae bacterium]|nr:aminotransferase class V-fold PLP-dependent enzyme [Gemmatimonadaceae bacterium]
MSTRRDFVRSAALASAASLAATVPAHAAPLSAPLGVLPLEPLATPRGRPEDVARDEAYWRRVASRYRVMAGTTNMEAGFFGMMASPVLAAYHRNIDLANGASSYFARRDFPDIAQKARERVATALGAKPTELAFSRNATEALQALIGQYNGVKAGDTVMYADLDYNAMQYSMNALAERTGATVARFDMPEPASHDAIMAAYTTALDANPRTKLLLLTHCNNKTGLITPIKEIATLARARGANVIVDAAHSFGQVPLSFDDLGADFVGLNLHKWIGAPVGAGALYIREGRLSAIDRAHGDPGPLTSIDSRIHTGTSHFAIVMTIPDALDFQDEIGVENKAARLRFLRDRWAIPARAIPGVDILTPDEPELVGAITSFRLHGRGDRAANLAAAATLVDEFKLFTVYRNGLAKGDCVRVTPALYNTPADADRLVAALRVMAAR